MRRTIRAYEQAVSEGKSTAVMRATIGAWRKAYEELQVSLVHCRERDDHREIRALMRRLDILGKLFIIHCTKGK